MRFTRRHEHELAEVKVLADELGQRVREVLGQLERIRATQAEL
jgi:hypothetical protein